VRPVGHVDWNELVSTDPERAATFYAEALGYTVETIEMPNGVYRILNQGGVPRAGIMKTPVPQLPSHWVQYVVVDDADAAVARATRAGGRVAMPPMEVPDIGRFGVIIDPLGAPIGVIKPAAR
jgi:predicted enzyme related to lactoylglutathione lyase